MVSWYYCANHLIYKGTGCKEVSREVRMTTMLGTLAMLISGLMLGIRTQPGVK